MKPFFILAAVIIVLIGSYFIYLKLPWVAGKIISPYGNAKIERVVYGHNLFFAVNVDPPASEHQIFHENKLIAKENEYCYECGRTSIEDIKWFRDSVLITYRTRYDNLDTSKVETYRFIDSETKFFPDFFKTDK